VHKRRNVADHLPEKDQAWVDAKLVKAFRHPDPEQGLANARQLAGLLDRTHPGAAASLREGLEEMFTVSRLGIDGPPRTPILSVPSPRVHDGWSPKFQPDSGHMLQRLTRACRACQFR
jgi:hypothetical protein